MGTDQGSAAVAEPVGEQSPAGWVGPTLDAAVDAALLRLGRSALEAATRADGRRPSAEVASDLAAIPDAHLGAFVTLTIDGELRGCMGRLDFEQSLAENVISAAASVTRDPRFPPLEADELPLVRVEVSAISEPVHIPGPDAFDVTRHGIVVELGWRRALLLPQVARERGWDARRTLRAVCEKAGLERDAWRRPDVRLSVFVAHEAIEREVAPI